MSTFKKICAIVLSMVVLFNVTSMTAFAADPIDNEITMGNEHCAEYLVEMKEMGFTEADVKELYDWNLRVANADSMQEIDALMDEYYALVADTPLAMSATATSFYSYSGGTLNLKYTGTYGLTNIIHTKAVYLPAQQVVYYQNALYSENFLDYIKSEFLDEGISVVTAAVAQKIAAYLGMATSSVSWLIGSSLGVTVWIMQNVDKWDLSDAVNNSSTGKIKIEFYYLSSAFQPYYQEFKNCEPWNSSYVEVPENYSYTWSAGVYDY